MNKIEYRVFKRSIDYTIEYLCFNEKGEFIVGGEPYLGERSLKELRDSLVKMIEAVDRAALEN